MSGHSAEGTNGVSAIALHKQGTNTSWRQWTTVVQTSGLLQVRHLRDGQDCRRY
ncbi:MAG: hypothetical protein IGR80_02355 [Synechococcales cyanobacterium K44_A2020_017]|nr:hypothetical protein [Synechococcales cyanobacterium K44_A2020_017]